MILDSVRESSMNRFYNTAIDETADVTPVDYSSCLTVDEAAMCALIETMNEYDAYEQAVMEAEMEFIQENGVEPIYEEAALASIAEKAVGLVKEWLGRILGVINRFMKEVAAKLAMAKTKLLKPNADKLAKAKDNWVTEWDFEDYDYTDIDNTIRMDLIAANVETASAVQKYGVEPDNVSVKSIKAAALGSKIKVNDSYVKKLNPIEVISGFKSGVEGIKAQEKEAKKVANEVIKQIKAAAKEDGKDEKKVWKSMIKDVSKINTINTNLVTAKLSLLMGKLNQAYKIAGIMLRSNSKAGTKVNDANAKAAKAADAAGEKLANGAESVKKAAGNVANNAKNAASDLKSKFGKKKEDK